MLYSLELESQVLSGLIHNPTSYCDVEAWLKTDDFYYEVNQTIYSLIRNILDNREPLDKVILISKLNTLSIGFKDNISPADYINGLCLNKVSPKILKQSVKELNKWSLRRSMDEMGRQLIAQMKKSGEWTHNEILGYVDKLLYGQIDAWKSEEDTIDLFDGLYDLFEERGNNPVDEIGIPSPYPEFNRMYGGFKSGDVYVFCARPGVGKTSFLNNTGFKMGNILSKTPTLIIDTEMGQDQAFDVKARLMSSLTGINPWYLQTGNWRKEEWMVRKIREERVNGLTLRERVANYSLHYKYLTDSNISNLISTIKRWYYTKVGRGNQAIISYDYLKLSGENPSESFKEHQIIGDKVYKLKDLVGKEVKAPLLAAIQMNRMGEVRGGNHTDSSEAIAGSDKVLQAASGVYIWRNKTLEEVSEEGAENGTHKLISLKGRFQGRDAAGHSQFIKNNKGKPIYNFINYNLRYFDVQEGKCAEDMYAEMGNQSPPDFSKRDEKKDETPNGPF